MLYWIIGIVFAIFISILALSLTRAAAPRNKRERLIDDYKQMEALGYFKSVEEQINALNYINQTITSGSAVVLNDEKQKV